MSKYSVIMTTYNRAAYLRQAVDSVLGQTYRDFELIVCDDGSTDTTPAILESYGDRVRTLRGPNRGHSPGLNAALALAQGEYVSILDSDDFWMPWTLEQVDKVVGALPQPACVYLRPTYFADGSFPDPNGHPSSASFRVFDSYAAAPVQVPHGSSLVGALPRQIMITVGGFWDSRTICSADADLILRLSRALRYAVLDAPMTVCVREHRGRSVNNAQNRVNGTSKLLDNHRRGMYGYGVNDPLVAAHVGWMGMKAAKDLAAKFGAWRASARLFRRTLQVLPRRRVIGASVWYGSYLVAIMLSRLLEQFSGFCARRLAASFSFSNHGTSSDGSNLNA